MLRLAALSAAFVLISGPGLADAPVRAAPFAPSWTCTAQGVAAAPTTRAPDRTLTFTFSAATRDLATLGAGRACKNAYPDRTVPGSCEIVACHATP